MASTHNLPRQPPTKLNSVSAAPSPIRTHLHSSAPAPTQTIIALQAYREYVMVGLLIQAPPVEGIQHITVSAGTTLAVSWIQHVTNIQTTTR